MSKTTSSDFICQYCHRQVSTQALGTHHRNHCPYCLWSKHVDHTISGDRKSFCGGLMEPLGLTFKQEGLDKYGQTRQGELMLIHRCSQDQVISINRIAGDDDPQIILEIFKNSQTLDEETRRQLNTQKIRLLDKNDTEEIHRQLFGKSR